MRKLRADAQACEECMTAPARGPVWIERAHRCRTEPEYARMVYDSIPSKSGKKIFLAMFPQYSSWHAPAAPVPTGTGPR